MRTSIAKPGCRVRAWAFGAALALGGCATMPLAPHPSAAPVIEAERAFAAEAARSGWVSAFRRYAAADAIVLQPDPVNAQEALARLPPEANSRDLAWWPIWAGIAASGDLGFTTGPYRFAETGFGYYFTVWRAQRDGSWRWIYDGGPRLAERPREGPDTPVAVLAPSHGAAGSADAALADVRAVEFAFAAAAAVDAPGAYRQWLAHDARLMGFAPQPAHDAAARDAELAARPARIECAPLGGAASAAGDLAYTYGSARWTADGVARRGHTVRIWQRRTEGWRLVFDQLVPVPVKPRE